MFKQIHIFVLTIEQILVEQSSPLLVGHTRSKAGHPIHIKMGTSENLAVEKYSLLVSKAYNLR